MNEWEHAESIANLPLVHEALQGFAEDPTGSNGTIIVREVVRVIFSNPKPEYIKLDEERKKCHGCINGEGTHSISCPERKSPAQEPVRKQLETAVNRINDLLQNDDGQAHKEARKFIESLSSGRQPVVPSTPRYKISKCVIGGYSVIEIKSLHTVCHINDKWASDNKNKTTAERICLALNNLEKIK